MAFGNPYQNIRTITFADSPFSVPVGTDLVLVNATDGAVSVVMYAPGSQFPTGSLPLAQTGLCGVQKIDGSANAVTVSTAAGAIHAPTLTLSSQYQALSLESDGSATWYGLGAGPVNAWGSITGTLASQTDLQSALNLKANAANPTFTGVVVAPLFDMGFTTTATAAGTTTLTAASNQVQAFTGITTQTVVLPVTSTLSTGFGFWIFNDSTGVVTVNSSGSNLVQTMAPGSRAFIACTLITGTSAASWDVVYVPNPNTILTAEVTADVTNATATMANLTDLTLNLVAGATYVGRMVAKCANSTAAEGISIDFDGSSATMTAFAAGAGLVTGGTTVAVATVSSALATDLNWTTITGQTWLSIDLAFTVNASGTFLPRFCEGAAHSSGTATMSRGTYVQLTRVS